ncbi:serine/threonine-protein kinase [Kutzneria sp. CA-103260]|uniref:serine/threonine-protein kinase n=1 Tax=Kutzneria sp. CA-103260 TaxID=2802641 RepID=UPI001BA655A6|nr:serine/threonine-protein kinase [Kutzneria sp. CA-103260]QUQ67109.1 Serine/threonine-protein kinase PknD [Kutzneria sp. CA-103260]
MSARDLEGQTIGDYRLEAFLGEGAFGAVFRSTQLALDRPLRRVAVKLSHRTDLRADEAVELLGDAFMLADAMDQITDTAAKLHLVHVFDAGLTAEDGRAFLAMEYVEGISLADRIAGQGRLDAEQLTTWAVQIASALGALHRLARPLMHRDLKPDNVMLGLDNRVRLIDFGLAVRHGESRRSDGVAGTVGYMAPEASSGKSTPASDVYSLGVLMYEGLTGQHPFRALVPPVGLSDDEQDDWLLQAKRRHSVVPPSALSNTVTPKLDRIVLRCLKYEPHERFRDAAELHAALTRKSSPAPKKESTQADGDKSTRRLREAREEVERELATTQTRVDRFDLLRTSAELHSKLGEHAEAASRLREAWEMTKDTGLVPDTHGRVRLLTELADAYRRAGNEFQAKRFEADRSRERGGGR